MLIPVRELAAWIESNILLELSVAPFSKSDEALVPEAGSCANCPKRTGFNTLLFSDVRKDSCTRSVSRQVITPCKTEVSRKAIPMNTEIADMLWRWRLETPHQRPGDWIFASPHKAGIQPYWPGSLFRAHIKPALLKAGISAKVGWHTLRHSFGTLMKANGEDIKTIQELLRHATFKVTADTYTQAVTPVKRGAQARVAKLIMADNPESKPVAPTIQ